MEEEYIILNTASFARDFEFFSVKDPDFSTLKKRYGANLDVKKLIIEIADGRFSMFLSKIPGTRTDEKGRQMFYNIVAKGRIGNWQIAAAIKNIAAAAIADVQLLGEKFDEIFKTAYLRQFDDCRHTAATQKEIQSKLLELAAMLPECYSSNYEIDEDEIKILVTNPKDDEETESIEDAKKRMINALNLITTYVQDQKPEIAKGIVIFLETDTLYKDNVKDFDEVGENPIYGYILVNENKSEAKSISVKKKLNSESPTETFRRKLKNGWMPIAISLLIISLIANVILLIWIRSSLKSEQQENCRLKESADSLLTNCQTLEKALKTANQKLAESSQPVSFFDETNKNNIELDVDEFRKNGWFKSFVCHNENDSLLVNDTIIVRSNVDFAKGICYINIHKTSCKEPPFIQVPFSLLGDKNKQEPEKKKNKGRRR